MTERCLTTPLGPVTLVAEAGTLTALHFRAGAVEDDPLLTEAADQLDAYFDGRLTRFDLPVAPAGSALTRRTCAAMQAIPFGETRTYGDLARKFGVPAQAIGQACGANPLPVLIPCHRILGASGLGGFSARGGVETKVWLLKHEGAAGLLI